MLPQTIANVALITAMDDLDLPADRPPSPPRRQRACWNCSKAKARCNFQEENIGKYCDRCNRLGIDCLAQTTKSLRRPRQLKPFTSRVASLEDKIDGIVSLLAAERGLSQPTPTVNPLLPAVEAAPPAIQTPESLGNDSSASSKTHLSTNDCTDNTTLQYGRATTPFNQMSGAEKAVNTSTGPGFNLTWHQANMVLDEFRINFKPNFPFITVRLDTSAQELHTKKPFLFRVIMLVASTVPPSRKKAMRRSVMAYLGQHLLVMEERELDLLEGLLVLIAWGEHQFYLDRQITHLISLAIGYAHNLGLTRSPGAMSQEFRSSTDPTAADSAMYTRDQRSFEVLQRQHTIEEQRVYLGCYYLMSVNSAQFGRRNHFKSPYVDMCCNFLNQMRDCNMDSTLEKFVRLQQLVDEVAERFPIGKSADRSQSFAFLINDEMQPLRAQLDRIAKSVDQIQFPSFWLHYNYILVLLYEPATYLGDPRHPHESLYQCQYLLYCLQAAKSYFTTLLSLPVEGFLYRSFASSAELVTVLVTAARILLLEAEGWDLGIARQTLNFPDIMDSLVGQFNSLIRLQKSKLGQLGLTEFDSSDEDKDDNFVKYVAKLQSIKKWYEARAASLNPLAVSLDDFAAYLPAGWEDSVGQDNQFWMGLLGNDAWDFNF